MATILEEHAIEESVYVINISFEDEDGSPVTPSAATYTLTDALGNIVNSLDGKAISGLDTNVDVVLQGDDLSLSSNYHDDKRIFTIEYDYVSSLGALSAKDNVIFYIDNLIPVP